MPQSSQFLTILTCPAVSYCSIWNFYRMGCFRISLYPFGWRPYFGHPVQVLWKQISGFARRQQRDLHLMVAPLWPHCGYGAVAFLESAAIVPIATCSIIELRSCYQCYQDCQVRPLLHMLFHYAPVTCPRVIYIYIHTYGTCMYMCVYMYI